jgi:hypothetical protein
LRIMQITRRVWGFRAPATVVGEALLADRGGWVRGAGRQTSLAIL